jgi:DNA processing protein
MHEYERKLIFSLISTPGIGLQTLRKLERLCDGNWSTLTQFRQQDWTDVAQIRNREAFDHWQRRLQSAELVRDWHQACDGDRWVAVPEDPDYPELLRQLPDPPYMLFFRGNRKALQQPSIAMVGTRSNTIYGKTVSRRLASGLVDHGWTVVSGLARGIDAHVHQAVLDRGGSTIAVLPGGLTNLYPPEHTAMAHAITQNGLLVSEQPDGTVLQAGLFPLRNRLIAGICYGTVVVEAAQRSGSLITAALALEYNRDVFAVPGPIDSPKSQGPLDLLAEGAFLVRHSDDISQHYAHLKRNDPLVSGVTTGEAAGEQTPQDLMGLSELEIQIWERIGSLPTTFDEVQELTKVDLGQLHQVLLSLQMKNRIQMCGPMQYVRQDQMNLRR